MDPKSRDEGNSLLVSLTGRQRDCMEGVKKGLSSKRIGRELGISHRTVEIHISAALEKMGANSRYEALALMHNEDLAREHARPFLLADDPPPQAMYLTSEIAKCAEEPISRDFHEFPFLPPLGGSPSAAPPAIRRAWIIRIAVLAIMLTSLVIISVLGLLEIAE